MKKLTSIFIVLALTLGTLAGCRNAQPQYQKFSSALFGHFDTIISIISYQQTQEQFDEFEKYTDQRFAQLNKLFDIYNSYEGINNIKTINDNAGKAPVVVDKEIIELIKFSKEWYEKTDGQVNIAFGSVLSEWHDVRENAENGDIKLPPLSLLQDRAKHTDISNVIVDEEKSTVYLSDPQMSLDVGAVAKGYATEVVCDELEEKYDNFAISAGGNVKTHGSPKEKDRKRWAIGVQNPAVTDSFEMVGGNLDLAYFNTDMSLVCSGGYQRFFVVDGRRYHHLIDPDTLFPEEYYQGVSVFCEDSGVADALSTAVFLMDKDSALKLIETIDGAECLLVMDNGEIIKSTGVDKYLKSAGVTPQTP